MDPSPSAADTPPAAAAPPSIVPSLLRLRYRGVPVITLGLLVFALSVLVGNYLPTRAATAAAERQLDEQRRENRALGERIRRAEAAAELLAKDPWLHERILRDELQMSRPGEVLIR